MKSLVPRQQKLQLRISLHTLGQLKCSSIQLRVRGIKGGWVWGVLFERTRSESWTLSIYLRNDICKEMVQKSDGILAFDVELAKRRQVNYTNSLHNLFVLRTHWLKPVCAAETWPETWYLLFKTIVIQRIFQSLPLHLEKPAGLEEGHPQSVL